MKKYNISKPAFTLAEVLIALLITGILAILVMPGMLKDVNAKARMASLKNTATELNSAISIMLSRSGARTISTTQIASNPSGFLNTLQTTRKTPVFASSYKKYDGSNTSVIIPGNNSTQGAVVLKSGVSVGIINYAGDSKSIFIIDVNGAEGPNTVGLDYYALELAWVDNVEQGIHAGDLGGSLMNLSNATIKSNCKSGDARACYKLAELSGFSPTYLE